MPTLVYGRILNILSNVCIEQLEQEIKDGTWYLATVSKEVLFRSRDRLGAKRAKPLWTEIIELMGDDFEHIRDQLYGDDEDSGGDED